MSVKALAGRRAGRGTLIAPALLVLAWLAATAWIRPLMLPDEGRYVGVAWEMMRSGDWLTPTLNGLPYFHKPPLFYWITATAMSLFGPHALAARAAPLLGAWAAALALALFARRWWGARTSALLLPALLAQPLFYLGAQFANLDMLVAGCITVAVALGAHVALRAERAAAGGVGAGGVALLGAYGAAALGVLAKGLIGGVIPVLVLGGWLLAGRRWRALRALVSLPGLLLFLAVAAPWFVAMESRHAGFLHYFFVVQHFERYAGSGFNNAMPAWFYPALLALAALPWLVVLPWRRSLLAPGWWTDPALGGQRQLLGWWVVAVVAFFSLPQSKLVGYVLPALPPLALLLADAAAAGGPRQVRRWWAAAALGAAIGVGAVVWFGLVPARSTQEVATVLRQHRGADEPVLLLGSYPFDLPLLARLDAPVRVVERWDGPDIAKRDDWRKELADAEAFDPLRGGELLLVPERLAAALCRARVAWVVGADDQVQGHAFLGAAARLASVRGTSLWRVDVAGPAGAGLNCGGTPSAGSAHR
ncbi:MAG: glycosyltransferase family 39 protein [Rubrivivax sp.]|nr:glycosyltransferase family 39 protein [Rubrivivax sp.]